MPAPFRLLALLTFSVTAIGTSRAAEPPATDAEYQNALVAAIHRLAEDGWEAEHLAVLLERHPKLVNERVRYKQPRKPLSTDDYTALHFAARRGNDEAVAVLLRYKADVNATAGAGWTPLHIAARDGRLEICKMLVKAGAKVDAKTTPVAGGLPPGSPPGGPGVKPVELPPIPALTPLELAKEGKHAEVVEYLSGLKP